MGDRCSGLWDRCVLTIANKEDAVARFAHVIQAGLHQACTTMSAAEHARAAHCAGGPSLDELEQMITEYRLSEGYGRSEATTLRTAGMGHPLAPFSR